MKNPTQTKKVVYRKKVEEQPKVVSSIKKVTALKRQLKKAFQLVDGSFVPYQDIFELHLDILKPVNDIMFDSLMVRSDNGKVYSLYKVSEFYVIPDEDYLDFPFSEFEELSSEKVISMGEALETLTYKYKSKELYALGKIDDSNSELVETQVLGYLNFESEPHFNLYLTCRNGRKLNVTKDYIAFFRIKSVNLCRDERNKNHMFSPIPLNHKAQWNSKKSNFTFAFSNKRQSYLVTQRLREYLK
jgi:hypothetical protein